VGSKGNLKVWPWDGISLEGKTKGDWKSFFRPEWTVAERALIGMKGAIQEFVDAIRQRRRPDPAAEESLESQAIVEQAYQQFAG
jgi:predicted dehydrogenase